LAGFDSFELAYCQRFGSLTSVQGRTPEGRLEDESHTNL
jgi:hypothetical protein